MEDQNKPRVVTSFEKISTNLQEQIKLEYPYGFSQNLISFNDKEGNRISALRFETDEKIYLIKMTPSIAEQLIDDDDDYGDDGNLTDDAREEYEEKYDSDDEDGDMDDIEDL
ncbi:MAG: hypothetical protein CMP59_05545 [Flavobacteriales bacterium]|nr:hypothetical protein [Flavobacteriales bacterium]|tara:strand:- start:376 stop:711 length:336 start_codon:yes stop_codon:yes gene_type:complete